MATPAESHGIIGRKRELEAVGEFLSQLEARPSALVFAGEPGIGKTSVWQAAVARAQASCVTVLVARPVKAEAQLAYVALADLLEPVADELLGGLPEPQRRALAVALLREDSSGGRLDQRAVSAAITAVLAGLARKRPVIIAVDDLQWLDRATARVLEFALRRLDRLPIGLLACERTDPNPPDVLTIERLLPVGQTRRLQLDPLSRGALYQVIKGRLGRSLTHRALVRVEHAARGNPFLALEIARVLPDGASSVLPVLPLPDSLRALVDARIAALPQAVRGALLLVAAARSPTAELAAAGSGRSAKGSRRALEQAVAAGIVEVDGSRLRFSHPLFEAAIYLSAPAEERRLAHRRLAQIVDNLEERGWHLALGTLGTDAKVADLLDAAAEHASARGAPEAAVELAEQALRLTPPEQVIEVGRRSIQAAEYQSHVGELGRARELLEHVMARTPRGPTRADALRLLGEICYHQQSFPEASRLFEEALEHVDDDTALASSIELQLAFAANSAADWVSCETHARRALALAEQIGDEPRLAEALAVSAMASYLRGRGLDAANIDLALRLEDEQRPTPAMMRPSLIVGCLMLYEGRLERSRSLLGQLRQRLLERGEDSDLYFVSSNLAWVECWRGDLVAAARYADEAIESASAIGMDSPRCIALAYGSVPAAYLGDGEAARSRANQALALANATGTVVGLIWASWALAILSLSLGNPREAEAALAPLTELVEREGLDEPVRSMFLADAIEALVALGQLGRAERLTGMLKQAGLQLRRGWALVQAGRCRALILAARGHLERAAQAAQDAMTLSEGIELKLERARTLLVAGQIERRRRRKQAALDLLAQARDLFESAGARQWTQLAELELGRVAGRPGAGGLTVSEERVARLAASGLTNREVAAQLFISPKTVEANLARVYSKLAIRSRAELGNRFAERPALVDT